MHIEVNVKEKVNYLKIWIKDDMEKSIHGFPLMLMGNTSLDPWLSNKTFIFQMSDANTTSELCLEMKQVCI